MHKETSNEARSLSSLLNRLKRWRVLVMRNRGRHSPHPELRKPPKPRQQQISLLSCRGPGRPAAPHRVREQQQPHQPPQQRQQQEPTAEDRQGRRGGRRAGGDPGPVRPRLGDHQAALLPRGRLGVGCCVLRAHHIRARARAAAVVRRAAAGRACQVPRARWSRFRLLRYVTNSRPQLYSFSILIVHLGTGQQGWGAMQRSTYPIKRNLANNLHLIYFKQYGNLDPLMQCAILCKQ